jgi:acyl-coenzyme A synthetase/AMP-(fatty) acid ligase
MIDARAVRATWRARGLHGSETSDVLVRRGAVDHPDTELVFHSSEQPGSATLAHVAARGEALGDALAARGIRRGDVVAAQLPLWEETATLYYACSVLGAVLLPIVHIYGPREMNFILGESAARMLVVPDTWGSIDYLDRIARLDDLPALENVVVVGDDRGGRRTVAWDELASGGAPRPPLTPADADDVILLLYTSGTEAMPKGVQHTHNTLLAEIRSQLIQDRASEQPAGATVYLQPFPAGHVGCVLSVLQAFATGRRTIFMDKWNGDDAAALIERHQVTAMGATPFFLNSLMDSARRGDFDLSSLREIVTGAAGVPATVVERAQEFGWAAYRCYGSTEHPTITSSSPDDPLELRATTDGPPLPGCHIRILGEDGVDVPDGQEGEIVSLGPEQFCGYRDAALNESAFTSEGWFRTGDIGRLLDGRLVVTDRAKDVIIRGGENISSLEVETVLLKHPRIVDAAAFAVADDRYGERVCAVVVLNDSEPLSTDDLYRHFVAAGTAKHKTPEHLYVVDALPRNASGKVLKSELRQRVATRSPAASPDQRAAGTPSSNSLATSSEKSDS